MLRKTIEKYTRPKRTHKIISKWPINIWNVFNIIHNQRNAKQNYKIKSHTSRKSKIQECDKHKDMVRETVQWKLSHMAGQTEDTTVLTKCHNLVNSNDPNIPFLCMKWIEMCVQETSTRIFTSEFIIFPKWKKLIRPPIGKWINKVYSYSNGIPQSP